LAELVDLLIGEINILMKDKQNKPWDKPPIPKFLNRKDTILFVGGKSILKILQDDYGLAACYKKHRQTLFATKSIELASERMRRQDENH
jgi:hypothetical protein